MCPVLSAALWMPPFAEQNARYWPPGTFRRQRQCRSACMSAGKGTSYSNLNHCSALTVQKSFSEWLAGNGVKLHGIESGTVNDGLRGVIATQDIPPGALLLQVPKSALITTCAAHSDAAFAVHLASVGLGLSPVQVLAAYLLYECAKGTSSKWAPYLNQLPESYTSFMNWNAGDIQALQVPRAIELAAGAAEATHDAWQETRPLLEAHGLQERWSEILSWQWAASTLASRTMSMPFDDAGCLTPFGDLHNYLPPPPPYVPHIEGVSGLDSGFGRASGDGIYHAESQQYCLYTRTTIKPGDQVYLCYGTHTNLELLEYYGFQLESNPHDTAPLPRAALARCLGEDAATRLKPEAAALHRCGVPTWDLLQALRLAVASPRERRNGGHLAASGLPIGPSAEARALRALHDLCAEVLGELPTSIAADTAELAVVPADQEHLHLAISWRISHKRILERAQNVAGDALKHVNDS